MRLLCAVMLAVLLPSMAAAQNTGIFIQGGPLLDIRFTSSADNFPIDARSVVGTGVTFTWNDSGLSSLTTRSSSQGRFAPGASVAVGVFVTPSVSLRLEGSFQGEHVTTTETNLQTLLVPTASRHATAISDVFVAAGWHQGQSRRVTISYLAGMVFRRQREDTTFTFNYPVIRVIDGRPTSVVPQTINESFGSTAYSAGVMAGVDVGFNLSQHLALVPQLRMVAANHEWSLRPAVAMRWRR